MSWNFYGWEHADIADARGLTPRNYYDLLSGIWCAETCAPRMRKDWSEQNRTLGQCSITSFLMQDMFGGTVYGVPLGDGNFHCFNQVGSCVFDLTSEQFGAKQLSYTDCPEQTREVHFAREEKRQRYELLKKKLLAALPEIRLMTHSRIGRYADLYAAAFSGGPWFDPWNAGDAGVHIREMMDSAQFYGLEAEIGGETAGILMGTSMLFHDGRAFEIHDLAVAPEMRRRGIASMLLRRCRDDMKEKGIRRLILMTGNTEFLPDFYRRQGFCAEKDIVLMGMEL